MSQSVSSTSFFPTQVPFGPLVDPKTGRATTEWILFFNQIFKRIGAETGFNADMAVSSDDVLQRTVTTLQGNVATQTAEISGLTGDYGAAAQQITALQTKATAQAVQIAALSAAADEALIALFEE